MRAAAAFALGSTSSILYSSPLLQSSLVEYSCEQDRIVRIFSLQSQPVTLTSSAKMNSVAFANAQDGLGLLSFKSGMQTQVAGTGLTISVLLALILFPASIPVFTKSTRLNPFWAAAAGVHGGCQSMLFTEDSSHLIAASGTSLIIYSSVQTSVA